MKSETLEKFILTLDGMIGALRQAIVLEGRTKREREATDLLVEARLRLVEELEDRAELTAASTEDEAGTHPPDCMCGYCLPREFPEGGKLL